MRFKEARAARRLERQKANAEADAKMAQHEAERRVAFSNRAAELDKMGSDELRALAIQAMVQGEMGINHGSHNADAARFAHSAALSGLAVLAALREQQTPPPTLSL